MKSFTALLALAITFAVISSGESRFDVGNLLPTIKLIRKMCYYPGVKTEEDAQKFMDCYDEAPGKEHFMKCQRETFDGTLFDSVENIKKNCANPLKIPTYSSCFKREFDNAGEDLNDAVRKLTACQLPILS